MASARLIALFVFLGAQALVVRFASPFEYLPPKPDFAQFSDELNGWRFEHENPISPATIEVMGADATLSRTYSERDTKRRAQLLVAWYQTQSGGLHQPHPPEVCLPARGWQTLESGTIHVGDLEVNRYIARKQARRGVMLYWYQTPFHTETSEWAAKFWLTVDALRHGRTDIALVRVFVPARGNDEAATAAAVRFVTAARAEISRRIPK